MIENLGKITHMEYKSLAHILRTLLLPSGINLRNLLWHGYLSSLEKHWFALCVVLIISIRNIRGNDELTVSEEANYGNIESMEDHQATQLLIKHGSMLHRAENIPKIEDYFKSFIPTSHQCILHVALNHYIDYDACFIAILSPLLEHSLRLLWCDYNDRMHDRAARPGAYYVTLGTFHHSCHTFTFLTNVPIVPPLSTRRAWPER